MVASNYTNTFGGENVSPANLSYVSYTVDEHLHLSWAFEAVEGTTPTADKIDVICTVANAMVMLPAANQVTVGQDILFGNIGPEPYVVADQGGNTICVITSGQEWFVWLIDNTTINGVWRAIQFGASTSAGTAADLAGAGLRANGTKLDQNLPTTALNEDYTILVTNRATVLQNDIGSGGATYTLPDAAEAGDGWFVYVVNLGHGNVLLQPVGGDHIDDHVDKSLAPGESLIVLSDGANYMTVGHGRSLINTVTGSSVNAAGSGTLVLSPTQVASRVQDFTGTLTADRRVEYGAVTGYWFVWNSTDPASPYKMTFATDTLDPGVNVPQGIVPPGVFSILRSNGTNMAVAFSGAVGTVTEVATNADLTGGPITTTGTLSLSVTGVVANTYGLVGPPMTMPSITVDTKGRITAASSLPLGTGAGLDTGTGPGQIPVIGADGNLPSQIGAFATGDIVYSIATVKPGWVIANSGTVGSVASGAWGRAHADTQSLFTLLWSSPAAQFPMYSSVTEGSVLVGRGASAFADFSANRQISVPDLRGTIIAGLDNAGGVATANRITSYVPSHTMGGRGGAQSETVNINIPQLFLRIGYYASPNQTSVAGASVSVSGTTDSPPEDMSNISSGGSGATKNSTNHTHTWGTTTGSITWNPAAFGAYGYSDVAYNTGYDANNAGTQPAINVQPTMVMNPWIKL